MKSRPRFDSPGTKPPKAESGILRSRRSPFQRRPSRGQARKQGIGSETGDGPGNSARVPEEIVYCHSARRVRAGSTRAARSAGTQHASAAIAARTVATPP